MYQDDLHPSIRRQAMSIPPDNRWIRAWLGGSFDPVHLSHLAIVRHVHDSLSHAITKLDHSHSLATPNAVSVQLLPSAANPFKSEPTAKIHRMQMLRLAVASLIDHTPKHNDSIKPLDIGIDPLELGQPPPAYTIDTVRQLRAKYPDDILVFVMGMDSLLDLPRWKHGLMIPKYVHLWVLPRQQPPTQPPVHSNAKLHFTLSQRLGTLEDLTQCKHGVIYLDNHFIPARSSTHIRHLLAQGSPTARAHLPSDVYDYIVQHNLYTANLQ